MMNVCRCGHSRLAHTLRWDGTTVCAICGLSVCPRYREKTNMRFVVICAAVILLVWGLVIAYQLVSLR